MSIVRERGGSLTSSNTMAEGKGSLVGAGYSKRPGMYFNLLIYISVFSGLIIALKYASSLELGTVSSVQHVTTSPSSSTNKPPNAEYVKTPIQELDLKFSSFQVCLHEPPPVLRRWIMGCTIVYIYITPVKHMLCSAQKRRM